MKYNRISRRYFLEGLGGYLLALPILPSLLSSEAEAQAASTVRFVAMFTPHGQLKQNWLPALDATATPAGFSGVKVKELSAISGPVTPVLNHPGFNGSLRSKINILRALDIIPSGTHNTMNALCASGNLTTADGIPHPSIDAILASKLPYPAGHSLKALHLMQDYYLQGASISYGNKIGDRYYKTPAIDDPQAAFQLVFGPLMVPPGEAAARALSRRAVVDRVFEDYIKLKNNPRLSSEDKYRLDAHLAFIQDLQTRIIASVGGGSGGGSSSCSIPPSSSFPSRPIVNFDTHTRLNMDIIVAAFKCGLTRVATLLMQRDDFNGELGHHGYSHEPDTSVAELLEINRKFASHVEYFLNQLNVVESDGKTYLDNSIILWTNELGVSNGHNNFNLPILLAGSGGGKLRTGYYMDYRRDGFPRGGGNLAGLPYNQLLITIMSAMGLVQTDWEQVGQAGYGKYTSLTPETQALYNTSDSARRALLPFLKS